jgi:hypothetical protein
MLEARDLLFARLLQYRAFKQVADVFAPGCTRPDVGTHGLRRSSRMSPRCCPSWCSGSRPNSSPRSQPGAHPPPSADGCAGATCMPPL